MCGQRSINESCLIYKWVSLHLWISHVTCMNERFHTYVTSSHVSVEPILCEFTLREWVMSRIWTSHVTYMNETFHSYWHDTVTPPYMCRTHSTWIYPTWMSHVTYVDESCHVYEKDISRISWRLHICVEHILREFTLREWVMPRIWTSDVTCMKKKTLLLWELHICVDPIPCESTLREWVMSRIWTSHVTYINETFHSCCDTSIYVWTTFYVKSPFVNESCYVYGRVTSRV